MTAAAAMRTCSGSGAVRKLVEQRVLTTWPAAADQPPPAAYRPSTRPQTRRSDEGPSSQNFVPTLVASPLGNHGSPLAA
jgi:hypothetical protein